MAARVIWSGVALDDLDSIAEYIHRDSPHHAQRMVDAALALAGSIGEQPLSGRVVPELDDPAIRERFLYSYRLLYAVGDARVEMLAIIHGRRLLESIGDRFA
ncbi:type II toxin-antitoxin system RelE/ParE family toxin [Coralloluteibacterium stylophorae]|uniref:Type II toxin-antitoxin system RelE/ParE family toxin n=1 Tax=Coralloluteibacterium stylophorae TaxID=1776034 RepID=A0AAP2CDZ5_9GAMM|nr:type II toxin-antitoxin system RelE/ParE family toxin [Coralloluteibacterium stylophorae]MBS7458584.1 type II toxin-antitoxin system RelE/ParE family toxin [Coralloluteibacterium stylophorae]